MPHQAEPGEPRRTPVLIPLDAEAALLALMRYRHSRERPVEPPAARERGARD